MFPHIWRRLGGVTILGCPCRALITELLQLQLTSALVRKGNNTTLKSRQLLSLLRGSNDIIVQFYGAVTQRALEDKNMYVFIDGDQPHC